MGRDTTVALLRIFIFALTLVASVPVWGARPAQVDDETLGAFLDQFFAEQLDALDVPGAAFVMVKNGRVRLARGYGVANRKGNTPFQPHTIVRAGSIVKTITALAALQLAEAGKLDLDADINQYLTSLQVPATFAQPVGSTAASWASARRPMLAS
jgi:CubicO group peptidase (beta-lactamase class C family)